MQKLLILVILALAGCVAYVAIGVGSSAAADQIASQHYKCYQARHAKGSPRFIPQTVFLTDQFRESVQVSVLKLATHCSEAEQNLEPTAIPSVTPGEFDRGLDCYTIRDAPRQPRFTQRNVVVFDKLTGYQEQTLTVSKAQSLCVPSQKSSKFRGTLEGEGFICYQAKTANVNAEGTPQPRFEQRNIAINDQFDNKLVRVIRPVAFCTLADKKVDALNDNFDSPYNAGDITDEDLNIDDHVSTVHSTLESNDPTVSCKTRYSNSVWYHWNSDQNLSLMIDTYGSSYDTVVAVFTGDKATLSQHEVACNDNSADSCSFGGSTGGCDATFSSLQFDATANTDYHILVASSDGHGGKLKFHVSAKDNATSNYFANAVTISNLQSDSFFDHVSTMNATSSQNDPDIGSCSFDSEGYGHSVWYTYTPDKPEKVQFNTFGSSYDTVLAVFSGAKGDLTEEACNDDYGGLQSYLPSVKLLAHTTYHILVGSWSETRGGKLKLHASLVLSLSGQSAGVGVGAAQIPDSITCYQVRQGRHQTRFEDVFDQFSLRQLSDDWSLTIGGVDSICVPSAKVD